MSDKVVVIEKEVKVLKKGDKVMVIADDFKHMRNKDLIGKIGVVGSSNELKGGTGIYVTFAANDGWTFWDYELVKLNSPNVDLLEELYT